MAEETKYKEKQKMIDSSAQMWRCSCPKEKTESTGLSLGARAEHEGMQFCINPDALRFMLTTKKITQICYLVYVLTR